MFPWDWYPYLFAWLFASFEGASSGTRPMSMPDCEKAIEFARQAFVEVMNQATESGESLLYPKATKS